VTEKGQNAISLTEHELSLAGAPAQRPLIPSAEGGPGGVGPARDQIDLKRRFFNLRTLLSFVIAALTLFTLAKAWGVDFQRTLAAMRGVDVPLYLSAFFVYALTFPIRGKRWQRLLRNVGLDAPVPALTETILLSWFVNCVAPFKLGDLYRGYLMRKNEGLPATKTLGTIFAERIIDSGALFVVLLAGLAFSATLMVPGHAGAIMFGAGAFMAILLVVLAVMHWHGARIVKLFPTRIQHVYHHFADGAFASFQHLPTVGLLTFLAWGCEIGRLTLVTHALGLSVPFAGILVVLSGASLLLTVPTPGGLGAVEAGLAGLLVLFAVNKDVALAVALLDRVISYWSLIAAGLPVYLFGKRAR
jgi:uncharacterized protein (TIRG00374 family)